MKTPENNFVFKYFDLIDEFIKVRSCSDETLMHLLQNQVSNKSSYRSRVVQVCVPDYESEIVPAVGKMDDDYDREIVLELLYQICIDVNPNLEIHQVSLPVLDAAEGGSSLIPRPTATAEKRRSFRRVLGLGKTLRTQIMGQDSAIDTLVRAVKKSAVGLKRPGVPIGTFLLVGRTGTGKTELAKALARAMYEDPGRLIRIDCSEYALPHEYAKLIGSPPGYIGHSEGGFLTESVRKKQNCIVLFDEIEKAHSKVHNLLLQLLDEGILTDSKGHIVSFANTVVIMTSNLGIDRIDALRSRMGFGAFEETAVNENNIEEATLEGMRETFRPEFINRIDEVVVFNPLDVKVCTRIVSRMLKEVASLLAEQSITVEFSSGVRTIIAREGFSEEYGARELRRLIKRRIEDPLTDLILRTDLPPSAVIHVRAVRGKVTLNVARNDDQSLVGSA